MYISMRNDNENLSRETRIDKTGLSSQSAVDWLGADYLGDSQWRRDSTQVSIEDWDEIS